MAIAPSGVEEFFTASGTLPDLSDVVVGTRFLFLLSLCESMCSSNHSALLC